MSIEHLMTFTWVSFSSRGFARIHCSTPLADSRCSSGAVADGAEYRLAQIKDVMDERITQAD
jgi:hypothetical protein